LPVSNPVLALLVKILHFRERFHWFCLVSSFLAFLGVLQPAQGHREHSPASSALLCIPLRLKGFGVGLGLDFDLDLDLDLAKY